MAGVKKTSPTSALDGSETRHASVPAVVRAVMILELVSSRSEPIGLAEISRSLELPKSSVLGICRTLEQQDLLNRVRDGYTVGLRLVRFAGRHLAAVDMAQAFHRALILVQPVPPETVQLAILDGTSVVYLARQDGTQPVAIASNTGRRLPASTTAVGKALLAGLTAAEIQTRYPSDIDLPVLTSASLKTVASLLAELEETRQRGYALDRGETVPGVIAAASAVHSQGRLPECAVSLATVDIAPNRLRFEELAASASLITQVMSDILAVR